MITLEIGYKMHVASVHVCLQLKCLYFTVRGQWAGFNLMFINPRPPVGAGAEGARCTRPSLTPPPAKNPGSAPAFVRRHRANQRHDNPRQQTQKDPKFSPSRIQHCILKGFRMKPDRGLGSPQLSVDIIGWRGHRGTECKDEVSLLPHHGASTHGSSLMQSPMCMYYLRGKL